MKTDNTTSSEVVKKAISFESPPRLPLVISVYQATYHKHGQKLKDLVSQYPNDFGWAGWRISDEGPAEVGAYIDEWGYTWKKLDPGLGSQSIMPPLENWANFCLYNIPDPLVQDRWQGVGNQIAKLKKRENTYWEEDISLKESSP
ncbi:MAG: hypothetical protein ABIG61_05850 [Planctomycetota bacterium]